MATTAKQIAANRLNAAKSTGPRSDAGKEHSRDNALKHGMTGSGLVMPIDLRDEIERRYLTMGPALATGNELGDWFACQAIMTTAKIDKIQAVELDERTRITIDAQNDGGGWKAGELTAVLFTTDRLKRRPEQALAELLQTVAGCDWLDAEWRGLLMWLDPAVPASFRGTAEPGWDQDRRNRALDLAGVSPMQRLHYHVALSNIDDAHAFVQTKRDEIAKARPIAQAQDDNRKTDAQRGLNLEQHPRLVRIRRYEATARRELMKNLSKHAQIKQLLATTPSLNDRENTQQIEVETKPINPPEAPPVAASEPIRQPTPPRADPPQSNQAPKFVGNRRARRAQLSQAHKQGSRQLVNA